MLTRCTCIRTSLIKRFTHYESFLSVKKFHNTKTLNTAKYDNDLPSIIKGIDINHIRNFSIIAHVDHGKSTLADRLLELTGAIKANSGTNQVLDKLQVERERGITVKAQSASLLYKYNGENYLLNLIDTPGHVDFSSEVSRSLSACQGVVLLVDSNDGIQAQTVANYYLAKNKNLVVIPVLNKIDLKNADPTRVAQQLNTVFQIDPQSILKISAKTGLNVDAVLREIVERLPPPQTSVERPFRALLLDSWYDRFRGVLSLIYVLDGKVEVGQQITYHQTSKTYLVKNLTVLCPGEKDIDELKAGTVGLVTCNMRSSKEAIVGDTIYKNTHPVEPIESFTKFKPMVYAGVYPADQSKNVDLRKAIEKLALNDSAVQVAVDSSPALGQGWRLGFLGLLHLDVFSQRIEQEYNVEAIMTAPSVTYKIQQVASKENVKAGRVELSISNPAHFPNSQQIEKCFEPMVVGTIISPDEYLGQIVSLCLSRRGVQLDSKYIDNERVILTFSLPFNEIVFDFHDVLKTVTSGYASFDYEDDGYRESNLVKLNIMLNGVIVDELSMIVHSSRAATTGKRICEKLKETIPRQMVEIAIQASVNSRVLARETLKAYRKDVTAKLYGGDVTRRKKLLAQQKEGKKRMRMVANVMLPRQTFIDVLKR